MSQTKVQLIAPIGVVTASTLETTGVLTATTFVGDIAGTVTGITSTTDNLDVGIVSATAFVGDFTGTASSIVSGSNVAAGIITGTKFVGNATGTVVDLSDDTNINVGILTSTSFVGDLTGNAAGLSTTTANLSLGIVTATSFAGNLTGNAAGISVTTTNVTLGIITASAFHGDGGSLSGVSGGPVGQQVVNANSGTTSIDLSSGNLIYFNQSANTTVSFANTEGSTDVVYFIRVKDASGTERTITWPSGFVWDGGTEPTLLNINDADEGQVFKLITRDNGVTWYGVEIYSNPGGGSLWALGGNNNVGGLGQNNLIYYSSPVQVGSGLGWSNVESNTGKGVFGLKNDGTLWTFGGNPSGSLGQNNETRYSSPVQIPGTTWNHIAANSFNSTLATKSDGTLWMWGDNGNGELGQNNVTDYSSPVQIPGTTWDMVDNGGELARSSFGLKTDGTLWAWGFNNHGRLGHNNTTKYSSPVQIPGTDWNAVHSGSYCCAASRTDGTLWVWGPQVHGTLGLNQSGSGSYANSRSSPTQLPGTTWNAAKMSSSTYGTYAVKTDGTLWAWGDGRSGNFAQNNVIEYSSPVQVPGTTWSNVRAGSSKNVYALKTDGTMWVWGANSNGKLGLNNKTYYSSPIQIPGTTWSDLGSGSNQGYAIKS
jgi:alpha-tubulin suppressor-like RCC1 family protein